MSAEAAAATTDPRSLVTSIEPVIHEACNGRLGDISWFKADWQRGGAATGSSTYRPEGGGQIDVVIKLPVGQRELLWTRRLQDKDGPATVIPRLLACGESIGGYDLAWVVIEQFAHGPLGTHWHADHIERIADAAARFSLLAGRFPVDQPPRIEEWPDLLRRALDSVKRNDLPERARWTKGLRALRPRLNDLVTAWRSRPIEEWLHGDLHLANAMSREGLESGEVSLIDLAEIHAGHWVEDAIYLERQLWRHPTRLRDTRPVKTIATARKRHGLRVEPDYPDLAMQRRVLLAATAPAFIKSEGHPKHLHTCLDWLERGLAEGKW